MLSLPSFSSSTPTVVCAGVGGGVFPGGLFNVLVYLLWPGRGWPGLGLLEPTPRVPSHHPHQNGTVEHTQIHIDIDKVVHLIQLNTLKTGLVMKLYDKKVQLGYSEHLLAASAWYQGARANHQHQADQHDQEDPAIQK